MKTIISKIFIILSIIFIIGVNSSCTLDEYVDCADAKVEIINNTDYFVCYTLDPTDDYCYATDYLAPGESMVVSYGEVHTRVEDPVYLQFFYRYGGQGFYDYAMDIEIQNCNNKVYLGN